MVCLYISYNIFGGEKSHPKPSNIFFYFHPKISNLTDDVVVDADGINCGLVIKPQNEEYEFQPLLPMVLVVVACLFTNCFLFICKVFFISNKIAFKIKSGPFRAKKNCFSQNRIFIDRIGCLTFF